MLTSHNNDDKRTRSIMPDMRYCCLIDQAGGLLAELRMLGASYEDLSRDNALLDSADRSTIGSIIHDLQAQVRDLERLNEEQGINPFCFDFEDEDHHSCRSGV